MVNVQEAMEELVEKQTVEGWIIDRFVESVAVMEGLQREEVMRFHEENMPGEWGPCAAAGLRGMVEKRVER